MIKEKRRARRVSEKAPVTISLTDRYDSPLHKKIAHCLTEDISINGIKIQSERFFPIDSVLKIQFFLKNRARLVTVFGKVRRVKKLKACDVYEMGIEIVETCREDLGALKHHIESSLETDKEKHFSW